MSNAGRDIAMGKDKSVKAARQLEAARDLARELGTKLDLNASLRLWDGSRTPLGKNVTGFQPIDRFGVMDYTDSAGTPGIKNPGELTSLRAG